MKSQRMTSTFSDGRLCLHDVLDLKPEPLNDRREVGSRGCNTALINRVHSVRVENR